jgi:hypothetical protein
MVRPTAPSGASVLVDSQDASPAVTSWDTKMNATTTTNRWAAVPGASEPPVEFSRGPRPQAAGPTASATTNGRIIRRLGGPGRMLVSQLLAHEDRRHDLPLLAAPDVQADAVDGMRKRLAELLDDPTLLVRVNGAARNTEKPPAVTGEQCDQQGGSARFQVDCPVHRVIHSQCEDIAKTLAGADADRRTPGQDRAPAECFGEAARTRL